MTIALAERSDVTMDLTGTWNFGLDPADHGLDEHWHARKLSETIHLPGSLQQQGFGNEVTVQTPWIGTIRNPSWFTDPRYERDGQPGNVKVPFWLQPDKHYVGVAWYQREVEIPSAWQGRRVVLTLERPHWETRVWVDDQLVGRNDSLSTPHAYDLGTALSPGKHRLTIRVDNRLIVPVGINAHSVSDHTQTNWNGIIGRIELSASSPVWIADAQVFPNVNRRSVLLRIRIGNATGQQGEGTLKVGSSHQTVQWDPSGASVEVEHPLGSKVQLWDEFNPVLQQLTIALQSKAGSDQKTISFGLRELGVAGTQLTINGRPLFLRGTLDCCAFPLTGYPPTDTKSWRRIIGIIQAHGLNHIRFHSWCPPEAAFQVADEMGCYLQIECATWANQGSTIGDGGPLDQWVYDEAGRILQAFGNHPSFALMAHGNEPAGDHVTEYFSKWVNHWKQRDSRRLFTGGAGWPYIPENDYHSPVTPRLMTWNQGFTCRLNTAPPETQTDYVQFIQETAKPVVCHEIGQWCVYPNFQEISKYTGFLKAKNFEVFRDGLQAHHMLDQAHDMLMASGKLQALCYKEEIESALRTRGFAGFQMLGLSDFPGQGTALVGVLDAFWDDKEYITAKQFRRFCHATVVLARLSKRTWMRNETLTAQVEVSHFGSAPLKHAAPVWRLVDHAGRAVASGPLPAATIQPSSLVSLGTISIDLQTLPALPAAAMFTLIVGLEGTEFENDWDVWVFPNKLDIPDSHDVLTTQKMDDAARTHLEAGGTVLLMPTPEMVHSPVALGFTTIFWNTAWTKGVPPHTLGILCDPKHPALTDFPTQFHTNWQWWELIHGASAMVLDGLPPQLRPVVQVIHDWFENRRLGLLYEAKVGCGRLLVCSMDLQSDLEHRPVARQMRYSLLRYLQSKHFQPAVELKPDGISF